MAGCGVLDLLCHEARNRIMAYPAHRKALHNALTGDLGAKHHLLEIDAIFRDLERYLSEGCARVLGGTCEMGAFQDALIRGVLSVFDYAGESAVYTPKGGEPVTITAIVKLGGDQDEGSSSGMVVEAKARARVLVSEVATPERHDTLTANGVDWVVLGRTGPISGMWVLDLSGDQRLAFRKRG